VEIRSSTFEESFGLVVIASAGRDAGTDRESECARPPAPRPFHGVRRLLGGSQQIGALGAADVAGQG
jgi:hypothetical protein